MSFRRFFGPLALVSALLLLGACSYFRGSTGDKILADETFFKKTIIPVVKEARDACKKELETTFAPERLAPSTKLDTVSTSVGITVPKNLQPSMGAIESKYGKPDKVQDGARFYGETGFRVGPEPEDKVVAVVITCTLKNIKAKN